MSCPDRPFSLVTRVPGGMMTESSTQDQGSWNQVRVYIILLGAQNALFQAISRYATN